MSKIPECLNGNRLTHDVPFEDNYGLALGNSKDVRQFFDGTQMKTIPLADDTAWFVGNGTLSMDLIWYGSSTTTYWAFDASADEFKFVGPMRPRGMNSLSKRFELKWVAGQRGKPGVNGDIQNAAEATRMIADPDFEVLGTNAVSGSTSFNAEGGITLTTAGADGDQVILAPHLDANQSAWTQVTWGSDKAVEWECHIKTAAGIATQIIWAGLKLTNTSVVATDDDQVFVRYENGVNSGKFQIIESVGGTDTTTDSGVTVEVSTEYHIKLVMASDRTVGVYINGVLVHTTAALTDTTDFIPYVGIEANGAAAAKTLTVYGEAISRDIG